MATGATYDLPLDVVEDEGRYTYTCFVMAVPRSGFSGSPQSGSCTVTVVVQDLAAAYAALPADAPEMESVKAIARAAQLVEPIDGGLVPQSSLMRQEFMQ